MSSVRVILTSQKCLSTLHEVDDTIENTLDRKEYVWHHSIQEKLSEEIGQRIEL